MKAATAATSTARWFIRGTSGLLGPRDRGRHRLPARAQAVEGRAPDRVVLLDVVVFDPRLLRGREEPAVIDLAGADFLERLVRDLAVVVLHGRAAGLVLQVHEGNAAGVGLHHLDRVHAGDA